MIHRTFLILFAVIFAYANTIFGINFEMVDLGLFESDESDAYAIDPDGTIHGSYRFQGKEYYFTWREDRGLMAQEKPFQAKVEDTGIIIPKETDNFKYVPSMYFVKRNAVGQEIYRFGVTETNFRGQAIRHFMHKGILKDVDGSLTILGTLGGYDTIPVDINDLGQIVGNLQISNGVYHAFLWDKGIMTDLGVLAGDLGLEAKSSSARFINNKSQILGQSQYTLVHKGKIVNFLEKAFLWESGKMSILTPELMKESIPEGLNDFGMALLTVWENGHRGEKKISVVYDIASSKSEVDSYGFGRFKGNKFMRGYFLYDYNNARPVKLFSINEFWQTNPILKNYWIRMEKLIDFNVNSYVLIQALNIYNERHVLLFRPVK